MRPTPPVLLADITREALAADLLAAGFPRFRADQVWHELYHGAGPAGPQRQAGDAVRAHVHAKYRLPGLTRVVEQSSGPGSVDGADEATKYLFELHDGERIETVRLERNDRLTVCVSTQVGCPVRCRFCASGIEGLTRSLSSGEIVEQVLHIAADLRRENLETGADERVNHVVFMGMGEPLLNIEATKAAAFRFSDPAPDGLGLSARAITISTIGFPDRIRQMAGWGRPFHLAVSWHAGTFGMRQNLVPTAKHSFEELLAATDYYYDQTHREPTFEYVLLRGVNDSYDEALALLRTLDGHRGKVQLIPFNPVPESGFQRPDDDVCRAFFETLVSHGRKAATRKSLGRKIDAACGQLYRKHRVG